MSVPTEGSHSCVVNPRLKDAQKGSLILGGKYGRMFPDLPAYLGEVGGRILSEVLLGLLEADPSSYKAEPGWLPVLPGAHSGKFMMADLLRFARAA